MTKRFKRVVKTIFGSLIQHGGRVGCSSIALPPPPPSPPESVESGVELSSDLFENLKAEDLKDRILKLTDMLHKAGICAQCGAEVIHWCDEPFSHCECNGGAIGEDTTGPGTIQRLRIRITELESAVDKTEGALMNQLNSLRHRNQSLIEALKAIPCPPIYKNGKPDPTNCYKCQFSSNPHGRSWGGYCPFHRILNQ